MGLHPLRLPTLCLIAGCLAVQLAADEQVAIRSVASQEHSFRVVRVQSGLRNPWSIAFLPDGSALISERGGALHRLADGTLSLITGTPAVYAVGQGGLLDIEPHPDFDSNQLIFFSFSEGWPGDNRTAVARARLVGRRLRDVDIIFRMNQPGRTKFHFGSRLLFLADGTLLVTLGDRGEQQRAQDPRDHAGSVVRIDVDGNALADNPFYGSASAAADIYTYGHRNPQGLALQPSSGLVWLHEHGPRGGDELNVLVPGRNYGWPRVTFGRAYSGRTIGSGSAAPGLEQPRIHWTPSIAPSGMTFYSGRRFRSWKDNIFVGALAGKHLRRLVLEGDRVVHQEQLLVNRVGRVRDVKEGPRGNLWLLTDERNGAIFRIEPR